MAASSASATRQAFQSAPHLQPFIIPNVRATGKKLGVGSYGSVEEVDVNGLICAGKKIHNILIEEGFQGVQDIARKYVEECRLMSDLRHPHIVQFMGVCFLLDSSLPVLVMERLLMSLDDLLEDTPDVPLALKRSILADVCKGLVYLHDRNSPIIHRDLSAKNVLLDSNMVAKISDLGNARIVEFQQAQTLSRNPGTQIYMPPEALYGPPGCDPTKSRYSTRIDIFSLGHLALFAVTQVYPKDLLPHNYPDPQNPRRLLGRTELERREDYVVQLHQKLGKNHSLVKLIERCLDNDPAQRPTASEALRQLEGMRSQITDPYLHLNKVEMMKLLGNLQAEVQQLQLDNSALNAELERSKAHIDRLENRVLQADDSARRRESHGVEAFGSTVLSIGSTVQISDPPRYGVIRWMGELPEIQGTIAGVELEENMDGLADGTWHETRFFKCPYGRGIFCPLSSLKPDQRFAIPGTTPGARTLMNPLFEFPMDELADQFIGYEQITKYLGEGRGIQGHQNSCYLDATAFGLFALSDVFDDMFLGEAKDPAGQAVSSIFWKGIVNPLRKYGVVRYESVMRLRSKLEELGKMKGVNLNEEDPEEFLIMLFKHTLNADPFISINRPFGTEEEYFVQLFVEYDEQMKLPTVGDLLNKMFREQDISFTLVPSRLLIQVPRYGKQFKTYKKIIPDLKLDVRGLITSQCTCFLCKKSAWNQCSACTEDFKSSSGFVYSCDSCCKMMHGPKQRSDHHPEKIQDTVPELELLSVICIETSHYVCFSRSEDQWIFFDSMAIRVYDTYNIPKGEDCTKELTKWVYSGDRQQLVNANPQDLPQYVRRFTQDVYLCVYIQPDVGMY